MGSELVEFIKMNDPKRKIRMMLDTKLKKQVTQRYGDHCIICGRKKITYAHIRPVEENGLTYIHNLVPLCSRKDKKGCHELYDKGCLSRNRLREIAKASSNGNICDPQIRTDMIKVSNFKEMGTLRPLPKDVEVPLSGNEAFQRGKTKAVKKLKLSARRAQEKNDLRSEFFCRLRLAEFLRRGCGTQALRKALKEIKRCEELLDVISKVYYPRYFYEYGYINHLLGNSKEAISIFNRATRIAYSINDDISRKETIIAELNNEWIKMFSFPFQGPKAVSKLRPIEKRLMELEKKSLLFDSAIGNRWAATCMLSRSRINIKMRRIAKAKEIFHETIRFIDSMDIATGWGNWASPIFHTDIFIQLWDTSEKLESNKHHRHLVGMCCRALTVFLGNKGNRHEGIKDILLALLLLLKKKRGENSRLVQNLSFVAKNTHDPSSGLF